MRALRILALVPLVAAASACTIHRMEIQQGNYLSQETVAQLKLGMTKDQVRFVLGTPLLADIFHEDRWDYVYRRQRENSRTFEERKLAVFFKDGKLVQVEGDVVPARAPGGNVSQGAK